MKNVFRLFMPFLMFFALTSCREIDLQEPEGKSSTETTPAERKELRIALAKTLARAMQNEDVRAFIKAESMTNFDGDNDVLVAMMLNKKVQGEQTFADVLAQYSTKQELQEQMSNLPLATIFIPDLQTFTHQGWDTRTQVPLVAVIDEEHDERVKGNIMAFSASETLLLPSAKQPTIPVVVLKDNERLVSRRTSDNSKQARQAASQNGKVIFASTEHEYYFIQGVDPKQQVAENEKRKGARYAIGNPPQILQYPFLQNLESHRDYIYYGIDPSTGVSTGKLKRNISEHLTYISFVSGTAGPIVTSDWTEGNLEFRMFHIYSDRNGNPAQDPKTFYLAQDQLFTRNSDGSVTPNTNGTILSNLRINVPLRGWDVYSYGDTWQISIQEYDAGDVRTITVGTETNIGFNYETNIEAGIPEVIKVGIKFGVSGSQKKTNNTVIQTTNTADDLGVATFNFSDPVLTYWGPPSGRYEYNIFERGTGSVMLTMEPMQDY